MKNTYLRSKLADIISNLDEIILSENEQTQGIQTIRECRSDLKKVLGDLSKQGIEINLDTVVAGAYRLIKSLHFWIAMKE